VGVRPALNVATLTESIQDTSPRIHPWRNKKPVSDETCPPNLSVGAVAAINRSVSQREVGGCGRNLSKIEATATKLIANSADV
jgi:hypothetical protein